MSGRLWLLPALLVALCAAVGGCDDGAAPSGPQVGGETNWLRRCVDDDGCGGLSCICGVCAPTCEDGCGNDGSCVEPGDAPPELSCEELEPAMEAAPCLPRCDEDDDCPAGARCADALCLPAPEPALAFPGAFGFGAGASGGRFGRVLRVENLEASGDGSLQGALDTPGPRIVVFAVSGVIDAAVLRIAHGDLTIAGQSAAGAGITLRGRLIADEPIDNVVIQHLRIRPEYDGSDVTQFDALRLWKARRVMLDHVSIAFGVDETVDLFEAQDVTLQHSSVELPLGQGVGMGADTRRAGLIAGPDASRISLIGNLFAHLDTWSPGVASGPAEVVGNLIYDAGTGFIHGNPARGRFNLIGNHFEAAAGEELVPFFFDAEGASVSAELEYFLSGNTLESEAGTCEPGPLDDPWSACALTQAVDGSHRTDATHDFSAESEHYRAPASTTGQDARQDVPSDCGAQPHDVVTRGVLQNLENGVGVQTPEYPQDYLEGLNAEPPQEDADRDGMADDWERERGLDPEDPEDHRVQLVDGYSAIEVYLQELAAALVP